MLITKSNWAGEERCLWTSESLSSAGSCPFAKDFGSSQGEETQKHGTCTQPCQWCRCSPGFRRRCRWGLQGVLSGPLPRKHNHPPKAIREYFRNQYTLQTPAAPKNIETPNTDHAVSETPARSQPWQPPATWTLPFTLRGKAWSRDAAWFIYLFILPVARYIHGC